jgi:hypothetical protein
MIYQDNITDKEFMALAKERGVCVSIYLKTPHVNQNVSIDRLNFNHMISEAIQQASILGDKDQIEKIEHRLKDLFNDYVFWIYQGKSLAVLANSERLITYRLPYEVSNVSKVSSRFYLKPLLPALHPQGVLVLAVSQKSVNLYEFTAAEKLISIQVAHLPADLSEATGRILQKNSADNARLRDDTGKKVLQLQFMRVIEKAIKPVVSAINLPLILATTKELASLYRSVNSYYLLQDEGILGSVENITQEVLKELLRPVVLKIKDENIKKWNNEFENRNNLALASSDLATIARLASQGQISKLLVDVDTAIYGRFDESGDFQLLDEGNIQSYDLVDEVVERVMSFGGEVFAVRNDETVPENLLPISASFRWV